MKNIVMTSKYFEEYCYIVAVPKNLSQIKLKPFQSKPDRLNFLRDPSILTFLIY